VSFAKTCQQCGIAFIAQKRAAKFCTQSCCAKSKVAALVERNKSRRKWTDVPGLSRAQVCYRAHKGKYGQKDVASRHAVIEVLGARCVECGYERDVRGLVLDHIHGDGQQDRKRLGNKIARYYAKHPDEARDRLQVLCAICNQIKAYENGEHNKSRRIKEWDVTLRKEVA